MVSQRIRDTLKALAMAMINEEESEARFVRVIKRRDGSYEIWPIADDPGDGKGQFGIVNEQKP